MKKLSVDEIKQVELQLLLDFDHLCKKNNLYYTLCGGTLLGAIRHKGFIPWDDDIDVLMPRPDFDRLINNDHIDYSCIPDYAKVVHWKDGSMNYPFMKLVDTRTRMDAKYFNAEMNINNIWIDIFPIDGNPDNPKELRRVYRKSLFLRKLLTLQLAQKGEGKSRFKRIVKPVFIRICSLIPTHFLCEKIDNLGRKYDFNSVKNIGGIVWGYGPQERIRKSGYMKPVKVEFEGYTFNAPSNYDEYLTNLYHDYMQLPPEDKRVTHDIVAYMDEK